MRRNPPTPLTPNEQEALALLEERVTADDPALARETAIDYLVDGGFERDVAGSLLDRLLSKGYLYEGQEGLRITDGP